MTKRKRALVKEDSSGAGGVGGRYIVVSFVKRSFHIDPDSGVGWRTPPDRATEGEADSANQIESKESNQVVQLFAGHFVLMIWL